MIRYVGAGPIFVDSHPAVWNVEPRLLDQAPRSGILSAYVPVGIYGQCAAYTVESIGTLGLWNGFRPLKRTPRWSGGTGLLAVGRET